ncbi:MAG: glycosyltransferase family 2 protein [Candidatus Obscuribacterales bacterium]|nr:glycosyltransferase family 2 protein [Candidatus Obscuribacterales bacterium]
MSINNKAGKVYVLILHWQELQHTLACLNSLRAMTFRDFHILVVDNGSDTDDSQTISRQYPEAEILRLDENLGFAGGCNAGIKYCLEHGADWIWLLNNDTKVGMDSLELLLESGANNRNAGALSGMVLTGAHETFAASGRGEIDFAKAKTYLRRDVPDGAAVVDCEWLSGSNLLLRSKALAESGLFDEDYFLYFEDTDLCHRIRLANWKCLLVPAAKVEHVGGASTEGKRRFWRAYYYTRNRLLFFRRYLKGTSRWPAQISIAGHLLRHALVLPFRGPIGRKQLKAEYLGLRDYMSGRLGRAKCLDWCD